MRDRAQERKHVHRVHLMIGHLGGHDYAVAQGKAAVGNARVTFDRDAEPLAEANAAGRLRRVGGSGDEVAARAVDMIGERQRDGLPRPRFGEVTVEGDDASDAAARAGGVDIDRDVIDRNLSLREPGRVASDRGDADPHVRPRTLRTRAVRARRRGLFPPDRCRRIRGDSSDRGGARLLSLAAERRRAASRVHAVP